MQCAGTGRVRESACVAGITVSGGVDMALRLAVLKDIGPVVAGSWRMYDAQPCTL